MVALTQALLEPDGDSLYHLSQADPATRLSEFSLTLDAPLRQLDITYENPLCRLLSGTGIGAAVCNQGCGILPGATSATHTCPFGLMMQRVKAPAGTPLGRWIGRRFPTASAMHEALDLLAEQGFAEERILASLPPNPIVTPAEIGQSALRLGELTSEPAQISTAPEPAFHFGYVMEYLEQVRSLIATLDRPEAICERFLRAIATVVPFDEMAIYLRGASEGDWIIAASVDGAGAARLSQPRPQACHLEPTGPGAAAIAQRKILVGQGDRVRPFSGDFSGPATLAIPFPLGSDDVLGVWLANQGESPQTSPLGHDLVRFMRLLSEFLSVRLQQVIELQASQAPEPELAEPLDDAPLGEAALDEAGARWDQAALIEALKPEVARATRRDEAIALVCLKVACTAQPVELPLAELHRNFARALRPYDRFAACAETKNTWYAILPHVQEHEARVVATRLLTLFEDTMDARGGTEEQGLRPTVGLALWGVDAISPREMIRQASEAALQAQAHGDATIRIFGARQIVVGL